MLSALFTASDPTAESVSLYLLQYTPCSSTGFPVPLFENKKSEKDAETENWLKVLSVSSSKINSFLSNLIQL